MTRQAVASGARESERSVALIAKQEPRASIGAILKAHDFAFTTFADVEELLTQRIDDFPALVVLWIEDPASWPARQIAPLRQAAEQTRIVAVCADIQRWELRTALSEGVTGVVLEGELTEALGPCLEAVRAGQICVPRQHWRQIEPPALSTREKQILGLVVMGYMNGQIAERLFLAESTVKSHLSSAFGKLGVRSRNEAVNLILDSERGLGMGILALGGEPVEATGAATR
jgi:DNA-binding NarL/FixJ family response regulator